MRQLVGLKCVICSKTVGSIVDGRFCTSCGCPVHLKCVRIAPLNAPVGTCMDCGATADAVDREQALDIKDMKERAQVRPEIDLYGTYQLVRFSIAGLGCGFGGLALLTWELSVPDPSFWGIVRSVLLSIFGFGLVGWLYWSGTRPR